MESLAKAAAERGETDKLLVRTHFGDDAAWQAVLAAGLESWGDDDDQDEEGFESTTYPVDDPALAGWSTEQVREAVAEQDPDLRVLFVADEVLAQAQQKLAKEAEQTLDQWEAEHRAKVAALLGEQ
jgi:hypothetical protein